MACSTKRHIRHFALLAAVVVFAAAGRSATAGTMTYFGADASILPSYPNSLAAQNSFFANLAQSGTDTLDSYTPASGPDPTNHPNLSFGATGLTATEAFAGVQASGSIGLAITNFNTLLAVPALAPDSMQLSSPVTAFGAYFLNAGDDPNIPDTLSLQLGNSVTHASQTFTIGTFGPWCIEFQWRVFRRHNFDPLRYGDAVADEPWGRRSVGQHHRRCGRARAVFARDVVRRRRWTRIAHSATIDTWGRRWRTNRRLPSFPPAAR
jgi:hypothetical protein